MIYVIRDPQLAVAKVGRSECVAKSRDRRLKSCMPKVMKRAKLQHVSQVKVGNVFGISRQRVNEIEEKAFEKLRDILSNDITAVRFLEGGEHGLDAWDSEEAETKHHRLHQGKGAPRGQQREGRRGGGPACGPHREAKRAG